jgi:hypothetical protein
MSRDSTIGIATRYGLDNQGIRVRVPVGQEFSFLFVAQTGSGAHPAPYSCRNSPSFRRNVLLPSSMSKSKLSKHPVRHKQRPELDLDEPSQNYTVSYARSYYYPYSPPSQPQTQLFLSHHVIVFYLFFPNKGVTVFDYSNPHLKTLEIRKVR